MSLLYLYLLFFVFALAMLFFLKPESREPFMDQNAVPPSQPDGLSWDFMSPKSSLKNFNETTELHQDLNEIQPSSSNLIGHNQPVADWVYPYTYVNRAFDQILIRLVHQMEKDYNNGARLIERKNAEWRQPYPYQSTEWATSPSSSATDPRVKTLIINVMDELNRRFNMDVPIVGFRETPIQFYWITPSEVIIKIRVYKKYTLKDIKYYDEIDASINEHLKNNFERELLIHYDQLDQTAEGRSHLKYLRFPEIDYEHDDSYDDLRYAKELDDLFYIAKSKDPIYRMLSNTEARDLYITKINQRHETTQYRCFPPKSSVVDTMGAPAREVTNQSDCELTQGLWVKRCEKDTDCPYYQKNTIYPNEFGGCDQKTGFCQMPVGVEPLTYRQPSNPEEAYCYNCPHGFMGDKTLGSCCQQEKQPDYMFPGDIGARYQNQQSFTQKNLNWAQVGGGGNLTVPPIPPLPCGEIKYISCWILNCCDFHEYHNNCIEDGMNL